MARARMMCFVTSEPNLVMSIKDFRLSSPSLLPDESVSQVHEVSGSSSKATGYSPKFQSQEHTPSKTSEVQGTSFYSPLHSGTNGHVVTEKFLQPPTDADYFHYEIVLTIIKMVQDGAKFWFRTVIDGIILVFHVVYIYLECLFKAIFPKRLKSLEGEIILITGTGNGIGRDVALHLAKSKAKLVCWDIIKQDNEDTVNVLKCMGAEAYAYTLDISDRSQVDSTAERVRREIGDVTIVINNAGIGNCEKFLNFSAEVIEKTFSINVLAHFWILRQFLPSMIKKNSGHIVTVCSIGGLKGNRYMVPYHGSKFAVHGYLESLKEELAHSPNSGDKINFTTVYPTAVKTRLINGIRFRFRFPSFTPFLESSHVASKIVDGLRTNTERVYVPPYMPIYFFLECFLPTKAQRALTDFMMFDFSPDAESKHFEKTSYHSMTNGHHGGQKDQ